MNIQQLSSDSPESNEFLKTAFRRLHDKVVQGINVSSVSDHLFSVGVLGADDYRALIHVGPVVPPVEQCRRLMSILYTSGNPEAFVQLREALNKEMAYRWLVGLVDEQFEQIVASSSRPETMATVSLRRETSASVHPSMINHRHGFTEPPTIIIQVHDNIRQSSAVRPSQLQIGDFIGSSYEYNASPVESFDFPDGVMTTSVSFLTVSSALSPVPSPRSSPRSSPTPAPRSPSPLRAVPRPPPSPLPSRSTPSPVPQSPTSPEPFSPTSPVCSVTYKNRALPMNVFRPDVRGHITGVAELGDQLFVVADSSDTIHIFDRMSTVSDPNAERGTIRVKGLRRPTDIVACTENRRLFVADGGERCIWLINSMSILTATVRRQKKVLSECWIRTPEFEPATMSARLRRLVVTSRAGTSLHVYRSDGKLLRRVTMPKDEKALHAVETDRDTFVVGLVGLVDRSLVQISEVDCYGSVLRVFGGRHDDSCLTYRLDEPRYLTLDKCGRVLVAANNRVLLLSAELDLERVLLSDKDDCLEPIPIRLCLVESSAQLVVCCRDSKVVQVYRVRPK